MKLAIHTLVLFMFLITALSSAQAEDRIELEGTSIFGNQELPKVLYIVPWKDSELPQLSEPPLESLIDEALSPIDRSEFRRQVIYYDALSIQPEKAK
jgi:2'-5' RNA ligase